MALSHELISQFAKIVKGNTKQSTESTVYGTVVTDGNGNKYVRKVQAMIPDGAAFWKVGTDRIQGR